jgi:hypothetical protein
MVSIDASTYSPEQDYLIGNSVRIEESEQNGHLIKTLFCLRVGSQGGIRKELIK